MDLTRIEWRKASYSGTSGGNCVEVACVHSGRDLAMTDSAVAVRDSKNPDGAKLIFPPQAWRQFAVELKSGEFGPA
jgi:hypothetical protein